VSQFTHALYIDESGNGARLQNINSLWVSAGVAISFEKLADVSSGVLSILRSHFIPGCKELHACDVPHRLLRTSTIASLAEDIGHLLDDVNADVWMTTTRYDSHPIPGLPSDAPAKAKARQFLFERVNMHLDDYGHADGQYLIVWDLSDPQELTDFSASVAHFYNPHNGNNISSRLAPAVLGGLSHDWAGLQLADVIANYALHYVGHQLGLTKCHPEKAAAFRQHLYPRLMEGPYGSCVGYGWKTWL